MLGRVLFMIAAMALAVEAAPQAVDRAQLEARLAAVKTLLEESSAARQIETSGNAGAMERREAARAVHRQAAEAFQAGDLERASRLLPEASALMFEGVRLAAPEKVVQEKAQNDFDARLEAVKSLLAAHKRISAEKQDAARAQETTRAIERLMDEARRLAGGGRTAEARRSLDQAYLVAKASIGSMRSGDTLVRSLTFATRQEEYRYEIDRNETHQMLIKVLLEGRREGAGVDGMVRGFLERAARLRSQAEAASAKGDYRAAIRLLEESTGELVRAIRGAGIYIPG